MGHFFAGTHFDMHVDSVHSICIMEQETIHVTEQQPRRLYRSETNKVFAGVCGGLGEYANIDPVFIRLLWLVVTIFTGLVPGLLTYILAIFVISSRPTQVAG